MNHNDQRRRVDVVVHTHWDREWYLTREATLARAAVVMSQVLDDLEAGRLQSFLFDGQTAAFRDLLAVAEPALAARLLEQAHRGRIVLGPWYVMADEFLVDGESLLRNLEFGCADCAELGGAQKVGYLPDSFGHVAQMPLILKQFGIHNAVLWRGADAPHNVFDWVAPDGTRSTTVFMPQGYYLHPMNGPDWRDTLPPMLDKLAARTPAGPLLLTHGGDHLAPSPQLAARMAEFNGAQTQWRLVQSSLAEHVAAVAALPAAQTPRSVLQGDLRHNLQAFVLPDVLSTRRYLKLAHQTNEDRLLGEIEPLLAAAWSAHTPYPTAALHRAWRLLIEQQAHDSICGCSLDAVHAEMQQRFVQLGQQLDALRQAALAAAGAITLHKHRAAKDQPQLDVFADDSHCTLFNPLPQQRSGWWVVSVFLRSDAPQALRVEDLSGQTLKAEVLGVAPHRELVSPLDDFPDPVIGHRAEIAVWADLPGLSALHLQLVSHTERGGPGLAVDHLDNLAWHVGLDSAGRLCLTDKLQSPTTPLVIGLLSELDAGDSYSFSPPAQAHSTPAMVWRIVSGRRSTGFQELVLQVEMALPAALSEDRSGRSAHSVLNHGHLRLRLLGDGADLQAQLAWHNHAQDQRTRLLLAWPGALDRVAHSDTAFDWGPRAMPTAQVPATPSRQEMPVVVQPSHSAISAGPWHIAHRAMQEFEHVQHAGQDWLGLSLLRSVGWLSRRDLRTRGVGAGPDIATPDAQCIGVHVFDFVLQAHAADAPSHTALQAAANLRRPPLLLRGHAKLVAAPLDIGSTVLQTSALRRGADGRLELRVWNPTPLPQALALSPSRWQAVWADGRAVLATDTQSALDNKSHPAPANTPQSGYLVAPHALLTLRELP
jgi:mannosylglycerate hydrolase